MAEPKKLSDILKHLFGEELGNEFFEMTKETTPEEFMQGQEYTKTEEVGEDEFGNVFTKFTYISKDGKRTLTRKVMNGKSPKRGISMERSNRLYTLEQDLQIAVDNQDFEQAVKIRDEIAKLKKQLKKAK